MTAPSPRDEKLLLIEAARGLAALGVVLLHSGTMMLPVQYSGKEGLNDFFNFGKFGVDFFFVLSGFIIFRTCRQSFDQSDALAPYALRRLFRILPTYWFTLILALAINRFQRSAVTLDVPFLAKQILLLDDPPWIGPAWTLQYELAFYAFIAVAIFSRRLALFLGVSWIIATLSWPFFNPPSTAPSESFSLVSPYCMLFFLGIAAEMLTRTVQSPRSKYVCLLAGLLLIAVSGQIAAVGIAGLGFRLGAGLLFVSVLLYAVEIERKGVKAPAPLVHLGRISYSLYISHVIFVGLTYAVLAKLGVYKSLPEAVCLALAVAISIGAAVLISRFIEMPSIRIGRMLEKRLAQPARRLSRQHS